MNRRKPEKALLTRHRRLAGLCVGLLLMCVVAARAQGPTVTVNAPKDVAPGSTVQVKLDLSQVANLGALFFDLTYDGTQASVEGVAATGNLAAQGLFASNPETFPSSTGRVRFGFLHAEGLSTDGTFVTLTFKLSAAAPSPAALALEGTTALNKDVAALTPTAVNGAIEALLAAVDLKTGLRLFTVPVALTNADPAGVLGDPAASVRVAAWDPAAKEGAGDYVLYDGSNLGFQAGRAYWLRTGADKQLRIRAGTPIDPASTFSISLSKGWNLVGNPFDKAVLWRLPQLRVRKGADEKTLADAYAAGWMEDYAWAWRQDTTDPNTGRYALVYDGEAASGLVTQLDPWTGCWMRAHEACELLVPPPGRTRAGSARRDRRSQGWSLRLVASSTDASAEVALGVVVGHRAMAVGMPPEPPTGRTRLRVASLRDGEPLAVDLRDGFRGRQEWEVTIERAPGEAAGAPQPVDVVLSWPDMRALPKDVSLTLEDPASGTRRYLRTTASHSVRVAEGVRTLRVVAEQRTGPAIALTGLEVVQSGRDGRTAGRTVRFHLSAPAAVDVDVVSPTGRVVGTVTRSLSCQAGLSQVPWNGLLAPGIYLVRVRATTEEGAAAQGTRALAVTR